MDKQRKAGAIITSIRIAGANMVSWWGNPRLPFVLLILCMLCYGTLHSLGEALAANEFAIIPIEGMLYVTAQQLLLAGTAFLLLMCELPKRAAFQNLQWIRTSRGVWLSGQIVYCLGMVFFMLMILTLICMMITIPYSYIGTAWSDTVRIQNGIPEGIAAIFPAAVRQLMSPLGAFLGTLLLTGLYWVLLSFLILLAGLWGNAQVGFILTMALQLLPWLVNTFASLDPPAWFPSIYSNIFYLDYTAGGMAAFWRPVVWFAAADAFLVMMMALRIRHADLTLDMQQE